MLKKANISPGFPAIFISMLIISTSIVSQETQEKPSPVETQTLNKKMRFELGLFDDRLSMFITQTAPLVQQFTGFTTAAVFPILQKKIGKVNLGWTASFETGLSFDSTGLARWTVRSAEQDIINQRSGLDTSPPPLTAELLYGAPFYIPIRLRTQAELHLPKNILLELGVESAGVFLVFPPGLTELRYDYGMILGIHYTFLVKLGLGFRARITNFGDELDRWPGFGATLYISYLQNL